MNWLIVMPILLPIAVGIFAFVSSEPIWKKLSVLALFIVFTILRYVIIDITVKMIILFGQIILFILLLIYYRNRGVL